MGERAVIARKRRKKAAMSRKKKILSAFAIVLAIPVLLAGIVGILWLSGRSSIGASVKNATPHMERLREAEEQRENAAAYPEWQEDWVRYEGKIYEYNRDIMTFLVMGIDKKGEVQESETLTDGGQADAIFLVVADRKEEKITLVSVNRDTMVDINAYEVYGEGASGVATAQIAVQHGYGDGKEESCELTKEAVSRLFYDLPIHGYIAINMDAIPFLNDAVGGVRVRATADIAVDGFAKKSGIACKEGDELLLEGMDAYYFVKWRDIKVFESARMRLERQKLYLNAFTEAAKAETKKDITFPVRVYSGLSRYMVTDITADEVVWLAGEMLDYSFDTEGIRTMEGETQMGELHEEFYPDEEALEKLVIEVFYREVEMD